MLPAALEAYAGKAAEGAGGLAISLNDPENAALKSPGGAIYVDLKDSKGQIIVWRDAEDSVKAFSSACTHKGARLKLPRSESIMCPAHGAEFDKDGKVLKGPAKNPLKEYKAKLAGDLVKVELK